MNLFAKTAATSTTGPAVDPNEATLAEYEAKLERLNEQCRTRTDRRESALEEIEGERAKRDDALRGGHDDVARASSRRVLDLEAEARLLGEEGEALAVAVAEAGRDLADCRAAAELERAEANDRAARAAYAATKGTL